MTLKRSLAALLIGFLLGGCTPQPGPNHTATLRIAPGAICPPAPSHSSAGKSLTPSLDWLEATHSAALLLLPQHFRQGGSAGHWTATATVLEVKWVGTLPVQQGQTVRYLSADSGSAAAQAGALGKQGQVWRPVLAFVSPEGTDQKVYTGAEGVAAYWVCRSETGELLGNFPMSDKLKAALARRYDF